MGKKYVLILELVYISLTNYFHAREVLYIIIILPGENFEQLKI
jgi:hypothetical protein